MSGVRRAAVRAPTTATSTDCTPGKWAFSQTGKSYIATHGAARTLSPRFRVFSRERKTERTASFGVERGTRGDAAHRAPASPWSVAGTVSYTNTSTTEPPRAFADKLVSFPNPNRPRALARRRSSDEPRRSPSTHIAILFLRRVRRRTHTPCFVCKESILKNVQNVQNFISWGLSPERSVNFVAR